jgi:hypothetical protein
MGVISANARFFVALCFLTAHICSCRSPVREADWQRRVLMSDPRNFECPWTDGPCTEEQCNYMATGYCLRRELEDLPSRRAAREKERIRLEEDARRVERKRRYKARKEREFKSFQESLQEAFNKDNNL